MSYTADSCRAEITPGQFATAESWIKDVYGIFLEMTANVLTGVVEDRNSITVVATSSHPVKWWNISLPELDGFFGTYR